MLSSLFIWENFAMTSTVRRITSTTKLNNARMNVSNARVSSRFIRYIRVAAPCICFVPWAALASCRPLPQQLLPVSAAGRARRRCTGLFLRRLQRRRRSCSNPPASMAATELHKKNACVFLHKRFLGGAKQPKSEPLPSGASLAAISSKVMVFVPSL